MIGPQIFQVATEFRFEVGEAILGSQKVQSAVEGISNAADNAILSFQKLGAGIVANMGLGAGGILSILGNAIQASDKFTQSQLKFANVISSNFRNANGEALTFAEQMGLASQTMDDIKKKARQFGLPASTLMQTTQAIAPVLMREGLDNAQSSKAIDLSRMFLKSAPVLGIDPSLAMGQLTDAINGRASMGDTLFQRLSNETSAMRPYKGSQGFNALDPAKRLKVLTDAFGQFSKNTQVVEATTRSLTGEMNRFRDLMSGAFSIFKSLGDVTLQAFLPLFDKLNSFLQKDGEKIVKSFAMLFKQLLGDPETTIVNILQARQLKKDTKLASELFAIWGIFGLIRHAAHFAGIELAGFRGFISFAMKALSGLGTVLGYIGSGFAFLMGTTGFWATLFAVFNGLVIALSRIFVPIALLTGFLQLLSRAKAIAQVNDAKAAIAVSADMAESLARLGIVFKTLISPFTQAFDAAAKFLSPLFRMSYWIELAAHGIDKLTTFLILLQGGIEGVFFAIFKIFENISNGKILHMFDGVGDAFNAGVTDAIDRNMQALEEGKNVATMTTNINKVEINNQFKEQMEPDRIAFTLKDQLLKAAQNPTQARGGSLQGAFAR